MKKMLFFIFITTAFAKLHSQTTDELGHKAPTLQIGLDGLNFSKGTLDAQLIAEIVAEKQKEIKLRIVQNALLSKLGSAGGAVYSYVDNVLKAVIEEKDQQVRSKKVIEASLNIVFVTAFVEYYLQTRNTNENVNSALNKLGEKSCYNVNNASNIKSLTSFYKIIKAKKKGGDNVSVSNNERGVNDFIALLLDMASECVRLDDNLKDLGLMQIPYTATYIYQNTYTSPDTELNDYSASRDIVFNDMQKKLNSVTQYIGLAYYATNQFTFRYNTNDAANLFNNFSKLNRSNPDLTEVINKINSVLKEIINSNQNKDNIFSNDIAELSNCKSYLEKASKFLKSNDSNCQKTISDIVYTIQAKFIPLLTKLNFRNASITDIIEKLIAQNELICYTIAETFPKLQPFTTKIQPFIKLLAKGYDFDKASTYSEYFKLISDLEIVFEDGEIKEVLSKINSFVKDYTSVGKDENGKEYIDFKVESFLTNLQQIKYDKQGVFPVSFLFTVGVNSGIFGSPVYLKNDTINNLSFVSEKIGLKIKLIDNKFWKTRNPGEVYKRNFNSTYTKISPPKEPIISDWHLLLYGSGILYNIAKLKTNSTFNSPLIGFGMGITCYNSLDVNLSIAYPLLPESKHLSNPLYNLGFDIRFGEYLDRLNKRKSQKNIQNILAKTTAK